MANAVRANFDYASRHRATADRFDINNHEIKILEQPAFDIAILDREEVSFDTKPRIILNQVSDEGCGQISSHVCQAKHQVGDFGKGYASTGVAHKIESFLHQG